MNALVILKIILFIPCCVCANGEWKLQILHNSDMHSRFAEVKATSSKCFPFESAIPGKCYGGFARLATLVRKAKKSSTPTLFLNAGDTYQGSVYYTVHKWKIVAKFLNLLMPDAISLGNHEFDDGPEGLVPFVNAAEFPIVTSNIDFTGEPELAAATNLINSTVLEVDGKRVGIIGYLTPETKVISSPGKVVFLDEVQSIRREVDKLRANNVTVIIALGHSGFDIDKKIATEVDGVDLVIGGHTNTFLYTGKKPDLEAPEGLYPTEVIQKNGRKVYVVQAYAYTKYLGNLSVTFDADGEVTNIIGNPILVTNDIEQASDILQELEAWQPTSNMLSNISLGLTKVYLDGDKKRCRSRECNLGNLITEAMVDYNTKQYFGTFGWTDASIAVINSGVIRNSINKALDTPVTMKDVLDVLPFYHSMVKVQLTGSDILEMLEHSVDGLVCTKVCPMTGRFLQFSGLTVIYNISQPRGSRVVLDSVFVLCSNCRIPTYEVVESNKIYTILTTDYLQNGGDGYKMLKNLTWINTGATMDQIIANYLVTKSPVYPMINNKIMFFVNEPNRSSSSLYNYRLIVSLLIIIAYMTNYK
ncbi:protein 5NUC-like [Cotesia glomerata]|uniref:protein 5NUC-like n=1 Tax=Cotesia glomerata TaxID=32391 RepID=UPI001D0121E1|nr:protein 5NUC-like [Cotesia glomerata]